MQKTVRTQTHPTRADGDYYFLLSVSDADQTLEYSVGEGKGVRLLGGDSTEYLTLSGGTLSVSLGGGDALIFKVFDKADSIRVEKDGIGIKKTESGVLTVSAPAGTQCLLLCLYQNVDDTEKLIRMEVVAGTGASLTVDASEEEFFLKVYAWDRGLKPITKSAVIHGY